MKKILHHKRYKIWSITRQRTRANTQYIHIRYSEINNEIIIATYADNTEILATNKNHLMVSAKLQDEIHKIEKRLSKWRIEVNVGKSSYITFALRGGNCPPVTLNNNEIVAEKK